MKNDTFCYLTTAALAFAALLDPAPLRAARNYNLSVRMDNAEHCSDLHVRSDNGEGVFFCKEGKVPAGMIFVPYGPPTCQLMGGDTNGTGMPTSKGWEVEVIPL